MKEHDALTAEQHQRHWPAILEKLREQIGETAYRRWLSPAMLGAVTDHEVEILVPTNFMRDWVDTHYANRLRDAWKLHLPRLLRVRVAVARPGAQPAQAPAAAEAFAPAHAAASAGMTAAEASNVASLRPNFTPPERPAIEFSAVSAAVEAGDKVVPFTASLERLGAPALDPRFTFENFVVGAPNEFAYAAAQRIAENPTVTINPLFLYGGVGLGKTHLMHAIAWAIAQKTPQRRVMYLSAEKFMFQFVQALRSKDTMSFKEQFRNVDVLMVDDVQFIGGKNAIQEEFFHTFNALIDDNKQIILSADKSPSDLEGLEDRLRSRLGWGLCADIHPTTYELRLAILHAKCEQLRRPVPEKVIQFLAHKISSNVRELEGALNRVIAHSDLVGREITLEAAQEQLADLLRAYDRRITIEDIQKRVAEHYSVKLADMTSNRRARQVARPRQVAMYLAKQLTQRSLPDIGRKFGGRDHTTVIHAVRKVDELKLEDPSLAEDIDLLRRLLQGV